MILLFTDFGWQGPYVGEMKAAIAGIAPGVPVIDLMHDAPVFRPDLAGHLLAALLKRLPPRALLVAVVDPGVGTERAALVVEVDGRWLIGPDNGLFAASVAAAAAHSVSRILWEPPALSASFHGRDLFAPVAARLAIGRPVQTETTTLTVADPGPRDRVIYVDAFGNAMTGLAADELAPDVVLTAGGQAFRSARTFGEVPVGAAFWYRNSLDLVELAVNQGSAAARFGLTGDSRVWIAGSAAHPNGSESPPAGR